MNSKTHPNYNQQLQSLDAEQVIELVGGFNLYQIMFTFIFMIMWMVEAVIFLSPPILYQNVDLKCYNPKTNTYYLCNENNGGCQQPVIQIYDTSYNTMTSQFQLYCDKKYIRQYAQISVYAGGVLGVLFLSYFSDKYGRKNVMITGQLLYTFLAILIPFVDNVYFQIINISAIDGFLYATTIVQFSFINESSGIKARSYIITFLCIMFPIGSIVYTYLFEVFKDWKTTNFLTITVPAIVCCLQCLFIQETPLYLFQQQKEHELMHVIRKIARINGRLHLIKPKYKFKFIEQKKKQQSKHSYTDLFRSPKLRIIMISCIFVQVATQFVYSGINFCLEDIGLDIYFNTIMVQIGHLLGQISCIFTVTKMKRKKSIMIALFVAFLFNFMQIFPQLSEKEFSLKMQMKYMQIFLVFMAKFMGSVSQCFLFIYYPEVFPTEVRNQASGLILAVGLISISFVPFVVDLGNQLGLCALFLISFISLVGFIFSFFLIETYNKPLLHTIKQLEMASYDQSLFNLIDSLANNKSNNPTPMFKKQRLTQLSTKSMQFFEKEINHQHQYNDDENDNNQQINCPLIREDMNSL